MKNNFHRVLQTSTMIMTRVMLLASYVLGIGTTSIVGKLTGKKFITFTPDKSSWTIHSKSALWERMY